MQSNYYSVNQLAAHLGRSRNTVRLMIQNGLIDAHDLAPEGAVRHRWSVSQDQLDAFLQRRSSKQVLPSRAAQTQLSELPEGIYWVR